VFTHAAGWCELTWLCLLDAVIHLTSNYLHWVSLSGFTRQTRVFGCVKALIKHLASLFQEERLQVH
jgi:hypothetical protein